MNYSRSHLAIPLGTITDRMGMCREYNALELGGGLELFFGWSLPREGSLMLPRDLHRPAALCWASPRDSGSGKAAACAGKAGGASPGRRPESHSAVGAQVGPAASDPSPRQAP